MKIDSKDLIDLMAAWAAYHDKFNTISRGCADFDDKLYYSTVAGMYRSCIVQLHDLLVEKYNMKALEEYYIFLNEN